MAIVGRLGASVEPRQGSETAEILGAGHGPKVRESGLGDKASPSTPSLLPLLFPLVALSVLPLLA